MDPAEEFRTVVMKKFAEADTRRGRRRRRA